MAGIYVHIPFCKTICNYCDFYSITGNNYKERFIQSVIREAELRADYLSGEKVETIYFGGGTPSVLKASELSLILEGLYRFFDIIELPEITVELNPDDIDLVYLKELKKAGFNRLSFGVQSWNDEVLKILGRRHNSNQSEEALVNSEKADFENISVDLIYGIPGFNYKSWEKDLEKTFRYNIKHLSAYHLTIERGTLFSRMKKAGKLNEINEEESNELYNLLIEKAKENEFIHYEISNFAKEGWFSKHNSNYWKQIPYIGLGPSAHSYDKVSRQWNISDVGKYISAIEKDRLFFRKEELDLKKRFNEYIMTSLRTIWGIDLEYVEQNFEKEVYDYLINLSRKFIDYGLMRTDGKTMQLTNTGKMISDNIISELMMVD